MPVFLPRRRREPGRSLAACPDCTDVRRPHLPFDHGGWSDGSCRRRLDHPACTVLGLGDALAEGVTVTALLLGAVCGLAAGTTALVATSTPFLGAVARLSVERYDLAADPTILPVACAGDRKSVV